MEYKLQTMLKIHRKFEGKRCIIDGDISAQNRPQNRIVVGCAGA